MINSLNYEQILNKLKEKGLSQSEIDSKIKAKMSQLSGLVSKEGAAHIIANELGVKIFEEIKEIKINNAQAGMRDVNLNGKVTLVFDIRAFKTEKREGKVGSFIVGDETGTIRVVLWDESHLDIMQKQIKEGQIIRVENGYIKENRGYKEIHLNNRSKIILNPPNIKIDDVHQTRANVSNSKKIKELTENDKSVSLKGTIVQIFDPRFFEVCSQCGKRAKLEGSSFKCNEHGNVNPEYSSVINCVLDDGSESIRVVFFRDLVAKCLGINLEDLSKLRENPAQFENLKDVVLGKQIKIDGRVVKNDMFNRIEFISNNVEELNPEMLLKELEIK